MIEPPQQPKNIPGAPGYFEDRKKGEMNELRKYLH